MKPKHLLVYCLFFTSFQVAFSQIDSIVNIPDATFKQFLISYYDLNKDNEIQKSEALTITTIELQYLNMSSVTGIEAFYNLDFLSLSHMNITEINISKNTKLTYLSLNINLKNLDVSNNRNLKKLYCSGSQITNLDLTNNIALTTLYCSSNKLSRLDLTNNLAINSLSCSYNQITKLDLTSNIAITYLACSNNNLFDLDLTTNTALQELKCTSNPNLTTICVSKSKPSILDIDVPLSELCASISFPDSNFTKALFKNGIDTNNDNKIQLSEVLATKAIHVNNESITSLSGIEKFVNLTSLNCDSNLLSSLEVSKNLVLTDLDCRFNPNLKTICAQSIHYADSLFQKDSSAIWAEKCDLVIMPDSNFKTALIKKGVDLNNDKEIQEFEALKVTSLNVNNQSIKSLVGIEKFINLTSFYCDSNSIVNINLSQNTAIQYLSCSDNLVTGMDLSENIALMHLDCSRNQLAALDISKNINLVYLNFQSNKLKYAKTINNKVLTYLNGKNNLLTSLDVTANKALESLDCSSNNMYVLDLSNNTSLVQMSSKSNPNLKSICVANVKDAESKFLKDAVAVWTELCEPIPYAHFLVKGVNKAWSAYSTASGSNYYYTRYDQTITFGDTVLNDLTYRLAASSGCGVTGSRTGSSYSSFNPKAYSCAIREDTIKRQVYFYNIFLGYNLKTKQEYLLYDFTLGVGDTSKCINNTNEVVLSTDYLLVSGTLRKRINFSKNSWIEGVGNPNSLYNYGQSQTGLTLTYFEKGECLFGDCKYSLCSVTTGLQEDFETEKAQLEIIPNPANKSIKLNLNDLNKLTIYNQAGITVKEFSNNIGDEISIEDLSDGLYFVKTERNNQMFTSKLIIQK